MGLNIAPGILERLDSAVLAMAVDDLEYTDFTCCACGRDIAAGSSQQLELLMFEDAARRGTILRYAHTRCASSQIQLRPMPVLPDHLETAFTPMMRDHVLAPTVLWELVGSLRAAETEDGPFIDPMYEGLRSRGFRPATQRLGELVAPVAQSWALVQRGGDLLLRAPDGGQPDEFNGAMDALPPGWLQAARQSKRVLVVYGSGFGLYRQDLARIDQVMEAGAAVAALVKWSGAPPARHRGRRG